MTRKVSPEAKQALEQMFAILNQKSNVSDFPCKDIPCEHWWVRYAVACTYLQKQYDAIWKPKLDETLQSLSAKGWGSKGCFDFRRVGTNKKRLQAFLDAEVILNLNDGSEKVLKGGDEGFDVFASYLKDNVEWKDCPYQLEQQSKCPFYKASEFYKKRFAINNQNKTEPSK